MENRIERSSTKKKTTTNRISESVVGIDPGVDGAVALASVRVPSQSRTDKRYSIRIEVIWDIPTRKAGKSSNKRAVDPYQLAKIFREIETAVLRCQSDKLLWGIELLHARPGEGSSSLFSLGRNYGMILGTLVGLGFEVDIISAITWRKNAGTSSKKAKDWKDKRAIKENSRQVAIERYPEASEYLTRKKDHNRAEAMLLADCLAGKNLD